MTSGREWPQLDPLLFGVVLVLYACGLPLGLDRVMAAGASAQGFSLDAASAGTTGPGGAPLAVLWMRALSYLPLGDAATRANLASALAGALAVALLGRLGCEVLRELRPPPQARRGLRDILHEPMVAALGALLAGLTLGVFRAVTTAGGTAVTLAVATGAWLLALRIVRAPGSAAAGCGLALLTGIAVGVDSMAPLLLWPPGALLWWWALRRGERWPLVAPLLFVAGLGILLLPAARSSVQPTVDDLLGRLLLADARTAMGALSGPGIFAVLKEVGDQVGVLGLLIGSVGLAVLLVRAPFAFALTLASLVVCVLGAGAGVGAVAHSRAGESGAAFCLVIAGLALPVAIGAGFLAGKLGMARLPTAAVLALTTLISPLLDGGNSRWARDVRLPARLLERGLGEAPLRAHVDPGSPEMAGVFRYAAALGLRPDLTLTGGEFGPLKGTLKGSQFPRDGSYGGR